MKITFITFHNWETKRLGGFHKFAEATAKAGHEVIFFSFERPYYIYLKKEERLNKDVLKKLSKGVRYVIDDKGNSILNTTWPTLRIPMPLYKHVPSQINEWFNSHSLSSFNSYANKYFKDTDVFVFESCSGVYLFDKIKDLFPNSKFIYRPSDPLMVKDIYVDVETNILTKSDKVLIVNESGLNLYRNKVYDFDNRVNYELLSNGVDVEKFALKYERPISLQKENIALYVGARVIEWDLILKCGFELPNINFIIVCPENAPEYFLKKKTKNIEYINGISPSEVPAWVTNCDVVIVPNPKGLFKIKPWGITAKYYQAMMAEKPIVAFDDTSDLLNYNVDVCYTYEDFIIKLDKAMKSKVKQSYNLKGKNWDNITKSFLKILETI